MIVVDLGCFPHRDEVSIEPPITIHGDGEQTRDFVYVDDVVGAWLRVLGNEATHGAVLNVGSGRGRP